MRTRDLVAFARRDWGSVAASKESHWIAERRRRGVGWCLEVADALRRQVVRQRGEWPTSDERAADLEAHVRVGSALRRVRYSADH